MASCIAGSRQCPRLGADTPVPAIANKSVSIASVVRDVLVMSVPSGSVG